MDATRTALIVLAAGASSRMGRPKPLLPIEGEPMLRRVVSRALASRARPVVVVLGNREEEVRPSLADLDCEIVSNVRWAEGQASSLVAGVRFVRTGVPGAGAAILLLGDQPFVSAETIDALLVAHESGASIAAAERGGRLQAPALFSASHFAELESLTGDAGAREVLRRRRAEVTPVILPPGEEIDLDTPEDYDRSKN